MLLLKAAGAATLVGAATLASMSYVVVDVKEQGPKGLHLIVPVPLIAADAALAFAPKHAASVHLGGDVERYIPVAKEMAAELRTLPDAELVHVQEDGQDVRIAKAGDHLEIRVVSQDEKVSVNVPLAALDQVLDSVHGRSLDTHALLSALRRVSNTDLVDVQTADGEHVRVWIW
jgi:hypothetical protein